MTITNKDIEEKVDSWNMNKSIFDIYDEIRWMDSDKQEEMLILAYIAFNGNPLFIDLSHHLSLNIDWKKHQQKE
jgi:hypothetical protein